MSAIPRIDRGFRERMKRRSRLKLLIPLRRSPHSAEYSARGVAVGMFWALTPLVGIQMYLCLMTWFAAKLSKDWEFSLVISFAWTWVTNVFTMLPIYYVFYVTGQIMMGQWNDITGYATFLHSWHTAFTANNGFWHAILELIGMLARELGISMLIGCLPYAILGTWLSYSLSLKYIRRPPPQEVSKAHAKGARRSNAPGRAPQHLKRLPLFTEGPIALNERWPSRETMT